MIELETLLAQGLSQLGLSPDKAPVLAQYERLLLEKKQFMNLTSITEP